VRSPALAVSPPHGRTACALTGAAAHAAVKVEMLTALAMARIAPDPARRHFSARALYAVAFDGDRPTCRARLSFPLRRIYSRRGTVGRDNLVSRHGLQRLISDGWITADTPATELESLRACQYHLGATETSHLLVGGGMR
jgi:hypothetical protein